MTVFAAASPLPLDDTFAEHARNAKAAIAANNVPVAKQELQAMLSIDPGNVDAHANLGMVEFLQGEYSEASSHFEAVLSRSPSLTSARAFLGMCELQLGKTEHGRKMIEESLPEVADRRLHVQAALELVRSYTESGMMAKAESILNELEVFDPTSPEVLYTRYRLHSEIASVALGKLMAAGSDSPWVHEVLGQNYMAQEQYPVAAREFRIAIERGPQLSGLRYQLGEALFAEARTEENRALAEKEFLAELKMNPGDAGSLYKLGEIALERSDFTQAKRFLVQALTARPEFADAHAAMGKILEQSGEINGAITELETAERISPRTKTTHYKLAQLYRAEGRAADADREFALVRSLMVSEPAAQPKPASANQ